jgi:hypothetical protein
MTDAVSLLREKQSKLAARVRKARASLKTVEDELDEVETALRVLLKMGLSPNVEEESAAVTTVDSASRAQAAVMAAVPVGEDGALAPKEVQAIVLRRGIFVSGNYVRTTLWRMARRGQLASANGRYWKASSCDDEATAQSAGSAHEDYVSVGGAISAMRLSTTILDSEQPSLGLSARPYRLSSTVSSEDDAGCSRSDAEQARSGAQHA